MNARGNRKRPGFDSRASKILKDLVLVRTTRSVDEIDGVIREFADAGIRQVAVSGGDGTIHYFYHRWFRVAGRDSPPPPLLVLGDGGMNMLFNDAGMTGTPEEILGRWVHYLRLDQTPDCVQRSLIEVTLGDRDPVWCFTFTDGFIAKFVKKYLETDGGPVETVTMISRFVADAVTNPAGSYRKWYWPLEAVYHVDGETLSGQTFCVASTIQRLILGFQLFGFPPATGQHMGFMTYWTKDLYKTAGSLPLVMWGRGRFHSWDRDVKLRQFGPREVTIEKCGLTVIDGEPYEQAEPVTCHLKIGPAVDVVVL